MTGLPTTPPPADEFRRPRTGLSVLTAFVLVLIVALPLATAADVPFRNDFAAYWPVGRLLLSGQNPYDPAAIEALQRSVGDMLGGDSVVRYAPWALVPLLPFAALPYVPGWYLWIAVQILLVGASSVWLWRLLGGSGRPGLPLAVAFGFPAGLIAGLGGQIGGILLFGVSLFLWSVLRRRDVLAGVCLGLLTTKPHLFLPLGLVVLLWAVRERRWKIPVSSVLYLAGASTVAVTLRPSVFSDFLVFLQSDGVTWQRPLSLGTAASGMLPVQAPWLTWVPAVVVTLLVISTWLRFADRFDWLRHIPLILALGLISAPYLLVHDLVLLVPALLLIALYLVRWGTARARWLAVLLFAVTSVGVWLEQVTLPSLSVQLWIAPLTFILVVAVTLYVQGARGV